MRLPPSPFIERNPALQQADIVADKALRWCLRKLRLKTVPLPIPVDVWIERPMGLTLTIRDLRDAYKNDVVEGNTIPALFEIEIDESLVEDDCRFRFACAHEIGHMLMHRTAKHVYVERSHIPDTLVNLNDGQADRFAVSFLMPLQEFFNRLFWLADQRHVEHPKFIEMLMAEGAGPESLWSDYVLPDVQSRFGIGIEHVISRVESFVLRRNRRPFLSPRVASNLHKHFPPDPRYHRQMKALALSGGTRR